MLLKSRIFATPVTAEQQQCDPFLYQISRSQYSRYQLHCSSSIQSMPYRNLHIFQRYLAMRHLTFSVIDAEGWSDAELANSDVWKERSVFVFWGSGVLEQ